MNHNSWHVSVLVPARDEEELLPRCLASILHATRRVTLDYSVTTDIVLVDDGSRDATFAIARRMLGREGTVIRAKAHSVGSARALAAQTALHRSPVPLERCWLANTDADCEVPETWLADQLTHASAGVDAVTGIVTVDSFADHEHYVAERFSASYLIHPDGSHPHVHGANIGVRADAYLRAGGWAPLTTAEDHDLWDRLRLSGARTLSDARLSIITSGRRNGRAPLGFAGALAAHNLPSPHVEVSA